MRRSWAAAAGAGIATVAITGLVSLGGCAKFTEPFKDAPTSGHNGSPAEVIEMPDGFNNVADKCDGHGNRLYVTYHGDGPYGSIFVVKGDPGCK
jgi:hypothetical protein